MNSILDIIARFGGATQFAREVGMSVGAAKQARRRDSIPAEWFSAIARAAEVRGFHDVTEATLAQIAERRRLGRASEQVAA